MRGRGLPEGWPRVVEGRTLFRTARAPGPFRPACRPGSSPRRENVRTTVDRSSPPFVRLRSRARLVQPASLRPILSSPPIPHRHRHPLLRRGYKHTRTQWRIAVQAHIRGSRDGYENLLLALSQFLKYLLFIVQKNNLYAVCYSSLSFFKYPFIFLKRINITSIPIFYVFHNLLF